MIAGPSLPGDANRDGVVDKMDAALVAGHWLQSSVGWGDGDFNEDNVVDDLDLAILSANWSSGGGAAVPEPSVLALVAIGALVVFLPRRPA